MLAWLIDKTVVVALLALLITLACRFGRFRPAVEHALWLILLLKLLCPPLVWWPWSAAELFLPAPGGGHLSVLVQPPPLPIRTDPVPVESATDTRQAGIPFPAGRQANAANSEVPRSQPTRLHPRAESQPPSPMPGRFELMRRLDRGRLVVLLGWLWGIGAAAILAHRIRQIARCRAVAKSARPGPAWLVDQAGHVASILKLHPPRVLAAGVRTPCVWCLGRPALVWPDDLADESDPARWRPVIAHELAHLKRRDHWVAWLQFAGECLWWWNPLFWFVRRRLRETAELACDAWAVSMAPDSRRTFAEALLIISRRTRSGRLALPALGMDSGGRRNFERRLTMIFSDHTACTLSRRALFAAWFLAMLAVPCWSLGQDKPAEDSPGKVNVTAKVGPQRTIRVHENRVYIADGKEKTITALDGTSGKILWQTKTYGWNGEADLVFEGDELYLQGEEGLVLHKLDPQTGKIIESKSADGDPADPEQVIESGKKRIIAGIERELFEQGKKDAHLKAAELKLRRAREALEHSERMFRKGYLTQLARDSHAFAVEQAELELANAKAGSPPEESADAAGKMQIAALPGRESRSGLTGLVELGTAYIEAVGERDLERARLSDLRKLADTDAISSREVSEAQQRLVIAGRKVELLTLIIDAARSAAEAELEELKQQFETGRISRAALAEAEMRFKILSSLK